MSNESKWYLGRLKAGGESAGLVPLCRDLLDWASVGNYYYIHLGPYASRGEALKAAEEIKAVAEAEASAEDRLTRLKSDAESGRRFPMAGTVRTLADYLTWEVRARKALEMLSGPDCGDLAIFRFMIEAELAKLNHRVKKSLQVLLPGKHLLVSQGDRFWLFLGDDRDVPPGPLQPAALYDASQVVLVG